MRKLGDLLKENKDFRRSVCEVSEKDVENIFFNILQEKLSVIARADIQNFKLRDKRIYLKVAHPAIASEIWRARGKLVREINKKLNQEVVEEMRVK